MTSGHASATSRNGASFKNGIRLTCRQCGGTVSVNGATMMAKKPIEFGLGEMILSSAAINPNWILEGNPVARNKLLFESADGTATTWLWDCTAGRFNWFYDIDETVHLI